MANTQSHEHEKSIDRITALYNAGAKGADFEKLQQKAVMLLNIEVQKRTHTREYERLMKRLDERQESLAEEIEQELQDLEVKYQKQTPTPNY